MRAWIYDRLFGHMTARWYAAALAQIGEGARVLDVGVGPGAALAAHAEVLRRRDMRVVALDVDPDYVARARARIRDAGLADRVTIQLEDVGRHQGGPYDAVYFSASFMLLDDPDTALAHVRGLLAPHGLVLFTQTFEHGPSRFVEWLKPRLAHVTTIEFGRVTYREDFVRTLARAGLAITHEERLSAGRRRSAWLFAARPAAATGKE